MNGTFRQRLACEACTTRKIRCDKQVPCNNCLKRGEQDSCHRRDNNAGTGPADSRVAEHALVDQSQMNIAMMSLEAQNRTVSLLEDISRRVQGLESSVRQKENKVSGERAGVPATGAMITPVGTERTESDRGFSTSYPGHSQSFSMALSGPVADGDESSWFDEDPFLGLEGAQLATLQLLIPTRPQVSRLVEYHSECLLWAHNGFHTPTFETELRNFYETHGGNVQSNGVSREWLALLFSILAASMISAPEWTAQEWGYLRPAQMILAERWHSAAIKCLELSQYLYRPTIHSVQAIATLTSSTYTLGYMRTAVVLIALGIRIAQLLGLHQLGDETDAFDGDVVQQEIGRRVWYTLVRHDYFCIPFSECYQVHRLFNNCRKPLNCREGDMSPLSDDTPSLTTYSRFLDEISLLLSELQDALKNSKTLYAQYEETLRIDAKMRACATMRRPSCLGNGPMDASWPKYIGWARYNLTLSSAHLIIMIHRKFLGRSFIDPVFSFTRKTCIAAAKTILKRLDLDNSKDGDKPILWTELSFSVTSCVILCFDILYLPRQAREVVEHRTLVEHVISKFVKLERYTIARKGVRLLRALLEEGAGNGRSTTAAGRKRKRPNDEADVPAQAQSTPSSATTGLPDVDTFVRRFWIARSSVPKPPQQPPQGPPSTASTLEQLENFGTLLDGQDGLDDLFQGFFDEDVADTSTNTGLFRPASMGIDVEEPATLLIPPGDGPARIPTFEDLLFRAETFDF